MKPFTPVQSIVTPLWIDDIDTDQIIPAEFLKVTDKTGLGQHLFANWRQQSDFVLNQTHYQGSQILVSGHNFGCGSSREHAPWALQDYGFRVIIAESFADIFKNNSFNVGLLLITLERSVLEQLANQIVTVQLEQQIIQCGEHTFPFTISAFNKQRLLKGVDQLGYTMQFNELISAYEQAHPRTAR